MQKTQKIVNTVGWGSLVGLALLLFVTIVPVASKSSSAISMINDSVATDVNVVAAPYLALAASPNVTIDVQSMGNLVTSVANVAVSTNSREGYSLYLSTTGSDNNLRPLGADNPKVIAPVSEGASAASFPANSWGYKLAEAGNAGADLYNPIPAQVATESPVASTENNAVTNYDLTFATKIDANLPADTYSNSVLISAIANPVVATSLNELVYMQDMKTEICENTAEYQDIDHYVERKLIDMRDGKSYYVAKLADGNCWMTQNLALDLDPEKPLTQELSDITGERVVDMLKTATENYPAETELSGTTTGSFNLGNYVLRVPTAYQECRIGSLTVNALDACRANVVYNVTGDAWKEVNEPIIGNFDAGDGAREQVLGIDYEAKTYDAHYAIGNYYQFNAAAARTGGVGVVNTTTTDSVCPKGWKLPLGGSGFAETKGSYQYLMKQYGITSVVGGTTTYDDNAQGYNIAKKPLYIAMSGNISVTPGASTQSAVVGNMMSYWTSYARGVLGGSETLPNYLGAIFGVNKNGLAPSDENASRWHGRNVRCLAR